MSVGLLIITHERIASAIVDTAIGMLGSSPLPVKVLTAAGDCDPDRLRTEALAGIESLDQGDGVLVVTDIYGSTPSNVACSLVDGRRVLAVSGVNLPMLVRVMNYSTLPLTELAEKAVSGGRDGVFACRSRHGD
jgi:mannose PTS system EIIA component